MKKTILTIAAAMTLSFQANAENITSSVGDYFNQKLDNSEFTQNTDNLWQLGYLVNGEFTLFNYTDSVPTHEEAYNNFSQFDFYKNSTYYGFGINRSGNDVNVFDSPISTSEIYAHPNDTTTGQIVLRFLAQESASYDFDFSFRNVHNGGLVGASINLNQNGSTSALFSDSYDYYNPTAYSAQLSLSEGDFLDITIDRFNGTWGGDSTAIGATATYSSQVPLPSTLPLILIPAFLIARKRKQ